MFSLAVIKESVRIEPKSFRNDFLSNLTYSLNKKYCNKVVINLGLCVSVFDILEAEDPYVHQGEASPIVKVKFRLVVFKPFVGELLEGRIRSSSEEGIHVSLGFFDDILIPAGCMLPNTTFDPNEQVWAWNYEDNQMFLDAGETIRFRILSEQFTESPPIPKDVLMAARNQNSTDASIPSPDIIPSQTVTSPFKLVASIAEDGLGLTRWWMPSEESFAS